MTAIETASKAGGLAFSMNQWQHTHAFGQDRKRPGETRTMVVIAITTIMMVVEIGAGIIFGSMALLADGLHMASHAAALAINVFAYVFARHHAHDPDYSFGTGKVNALGGFTGAVLLAVFALIMAWESVARIVNPVEIALDQAILVAVLGLMVNGVSVIILGHRSHNHRHDGHHHSAHGNDHNLRAAYLHVFADALTSFLAILALLAAKYFDYVWMDPVMGIVGAVLVARWSLGLVKMTSAVLLDKQGPKHIQAKIRESLELDGCRVVDLHLWAIGPGIHSVIVSLEAVEPQPVDLYKKLIPSDLGLVHITVEVIQRSSDASENG